jgi:hypothetical protein
MPTLSIRISRSLIFSLLFGIFPILTLSKSNLGQIQSSFFLKPILFSLIFTLMIYGICLIISRSWERAAAFSGVISLFVFSFGHVYNLVGQKTFLGISVGFIKLLFLYLVFFAGVVFLLSRVKKFPNTLFIVLNLMAGCLIFLNLIPIIAFEIRQGANTPISQGLSDIKTAAPEDLPDIYYILLDAYAREDVLNEVIGYDNSAFLQELEERGFYIPDCAFSNYHATALTLPSVLNFDYIHNLNIAYHPDSESVEDINILVNNNARVYFSSLGYQFVTGRGFSSRVDIIDSDIYFNYFQDNEGKDDFEAQSFLSLYLNTTIYRIITELYKNNPEKFSWLPYWLAIDREFDPYLQQASLWYYQNKYMLDSIQELPDNTGPFFVYAHIIAPHPPYAFRSDGTLRYPLDTQDEKVLYADQVTYLNKRVLELVDALQANSSIQPIIIIQADHGIHQLTSGLDKHKIFSAYYLPGILNTDPYPTITPVNNFRLIIKNYFDTSMMLLPDILYVKWVDNDEPVASSCDLEP